MGDIDHLLIGPSGVWVLETKWSADSWMSTNGDQFMSDRLRRAVEQVARNAADVGHQFSHKLGQAAVRAVVVLWTSPGNTSNVQDAGELDGVFIVPGPGLKDWLDSVVLSGPTCVEVPQLWTAVEEHARKRDASDASRGIGFRPSLQRLFWQRVAIPVVATTGAVYAFFATSRFHQWLPLVVEAVAALIVGAVASRQERLRWAAAGWLVGVLAGLLVLLVSTIT